MLWPAQAAVLIVVGLQLTMGARLTFGPIWLAPLIESALLIPLAATSSFDHLVGSRARRWTAIGMIGVINAANFFSLAVVVHQLLNGSKATGAQLIYEAMKVWLF